jgi:acetolactate synthase-1/2/3 large subunit
MQLAASFDCHGIRVEDSSELRPALDEAFLADRPVIISLPIDYRENQKLTEKLGNLACPI